MSKQIAPKARFTPGPWTARIQRGREGRDLGWIIEFSNGRIGWADLAYADTNSGATADDPAREANAALIAAAPEMLMALQMALPALEWCQKQWAASPQQGDGVNVLRFARAAIAAAEGRDNG